MVEYKSLGREMKKSKFYSFESVLKKACQQVKPEKVLEWGTGHSTKIINDNSDAQILTIEHDLIYYKKALADFQEYPNIEVVHKALIMAGRGGQSTGYINYPIYKALKDNVEDLRIYDLIFVDGRSRFDCIITGRLLLKDTGILLVHDTHRKNYMPAVKSFPYYRNFTDVRTAAMAKTPIIDFLGE
jgi:predicted O-methyltransferase YrrM